MISKISAPVPLSPYAVRLESGNEYYFSRLELRKLRGEEAKTTSQAAQTTDGARKNPAAAQSVSAGPNDPPRNLAIELTVTVISMIGGAFVGVWTGGDGLGWVSFVILCALLGWLIWIRRRRSVLATIGICILLIVAWWPFGLLLRELGRDRF